MSPPDHVGISDDDDDDELDDEKAGEFERPNPSARNL